MMPISSADINNRLIYRICALYNQHKLDSGAKRFSSPSAFAQQLSSLSYTVTVYEDPNLLDECLDILPLEKLYSEAEKASEIDLSWGLQDHIIMALLK